MFTSAGAGLQRPHGELMTQAVDPRRAWSGLRTERDEPEEEVKRPVDHPIGEGLAFG